MSIFGRWKARRKTEREFIKPVLREVEEKEYRREKQRVDEEQMVKRVEAAKERGRRRARDKTSLGGSFTRIGREIARRRGPSIVSAGKNIGNTVKRVGSNLDRAEKKQGKKGKKRGKKGDDDFFFF